MNKILIHIPHAKTKLPINYRQKVIISPTAFNNFLFDIADLYVDKLTDNTFKKICPKYSRVFCDVERFADDNKEIMSKFGMGMIYTKTHEGMDFFQKTNQYVQKIKTTYYDKYHEKLNTITTKMIESLTANDNLIIIDLHSFSAKILVNKTSLNAPLPDLCIGFDKIGATKQLVDFTEQYFSKSGLSIQLNYPYTSSILPNKYLSGNKQLKSIMLEFNKTIYMDINSNKLDKNKLKHLKNIVKKYLESLTQLTLDTPPDTTAKSNS